MEKASLSLRENPLKIRGSEWKPARSMIRLLLVDAGSWKLTSGHPVYSARSLEVGRKLDRDESRLATAPS